jgi:uncharacterized membrane protein YkvA (DUF1232 family)
MNTLRLIAHLPNFIKLYWRLFTDKRVSWLPKAAVVVGLAYALLPLDFLPDLALPFGLADDTAVAIAALWAFIKLCPKRIVQEHVEIIDQGG